MQGRKLMRGTTRLEDNNPPPQNLTVKTVHRYYFHSRQKLQKVIHFSICTSLHLPPAL
jgi:hypothetical protein